MFSDFSAGVCPECAGDPLETHEDAKKWLRMIGQAFVTLALDKGDAQAGIRAVEAWLKAEGDRVGLVLPDDLRPDVKQLKDDREAPVLKLEDKA